MSTATEITSVPIDFIYGILSNDSQLTVFGMKAIYPSGEIPQVNNESERAGRYPGVLIGSPVYDPDLLGGGGNLIWSPTYHEVVAIDLSWNFRVLEQLAGRIHQLLHTASGSAPGGGYVNSCRRRRPVRVTQTTNGISFLRVGGLYLLRPRMSNS
jgi:hypothetical protein